MFLLGLKRVRSTMCDCAHVNICTITHGGPTGAFEQKPTVQKVSQISPVTQKTVTGLDFCNEGAEIGPIFNLIQSYWGKNACRIIPVHHKIRARNQNLRYTGSIRHFLKNLFPIFPNQSS
jgi:hypothetical protein